MMGNWVLKTDISPEQMRESKKRGMSVAWLGTPWMTMWVGAGSILCVKIIQPCTADEVLQTRKRQRSVVGSCPELWLRKKYYIITSGCELQQNYLLAQYEVVYLDSYIV
jgi:hypothetical protein